MKNIYMEPQASVDEVIYTDMLCTSSDATNESFEQEIDIVW